MTPPISAQHRSKSTANRDAEKPKNENALEALGCGWWSSNLNDEKRLRLARQLRSSHLGTTSSPAAALLEAREWYKGRPQNHRRLTARANEATIAGKRVRDMANGLFYAAQSAEKRPPLQRYRRAPQTRLYDDAADVLLDIVTG